MIRRHGPRSAGSPCSSSTTAASASAGRASGVRDSRSLVRAMTAVHCLGGHTQIRRVLQHALDETQVQRVHALVFVGDAMEENVDELCAIAGELGLRRRSRLHVPRGAPIRGPRWPFARSRGSPTGAYLRFDASSARQLKELLGAVAVYAAGGRKALTDYGPPARRGGACRSPIRSNEPSRHAHPPSDPLNYAHDDSLRPSRARTPGAGGVPRPLVRHGQSLEPRALGQVGHHRRRRGGRDLPRRPPARRISPSCRWHSPGCPGSWGAWRRAG